MNKETLDRYVSEGWLVSQKHPTLPLAIYNYSQSTQYEEHWDDVTLSCRGLIVDSETGEVLVKPFPKFFNYEEVEEEVPWESSEYVYVQEKMDGSLGILFNYKGEWILATRGSFTSPQAVRGMEILGSKYNLDNFNSSIAYMVEIVYPENRIVVDYGEEKITFLGAMVKRESLNEGGPDELNWATANSFFHSSEISEEDIVPTEMYFNNPEKREISSFGHSMYESLKGKNLKNKEGFVLRFYPSNYRCKIKFEDYVKLHRIVTQVSSYDIWENLKDHGKLPESFLTNVPDEFYEWVKKVETEILENFRFIKSLHHAHVSSILRYGMEDRKEIAKAFMTIKDHRVNSGILFTILDGRSPDPKIWDLVKPEYSRPFSDKSGGILKTIK
jgi:RNA ligase